MKVEFANTILLTKILSKLGFEPNLKEGKSLGYVSPLDPETGVCFYVDSEHNEWYDFGEQTGGNTIDFVCAYLKSQNENHQISDALRWLNNIAGYVPNVPQEYYPDYSKEKGLFSIRSIKPVKKMQLVQYLRSKGISINLAKKHLVQLRLLNKKTKEVSYALGFRNEDNGFEIRAKDFKASRGKKAITFIRGLQPKPPGVHIFKSFEDYLSIITHLDCKYYNDDSIILNCYSCMKDAAAYIKNYGYRTAYTWMDNTIAGNIATEEFHKFLNTEEGLQHQKQNKLYEAFKNVSSWLMHKWGLSDNERFSSQLQQAS